MTDKNEYDVKYSHRIEAPWELYSMRQRSVFLTILFLVATTNVVDRQVINVLIEPIKTEFQVSDSMMGLLSGLAFSMFYVTLGIPAARWADKGNRLNIMAIGLTVWSVMAAVCGFAQSFWQLVTARLFVGAGESTSGPASQSLIADYYPPEKRSFALGVFLMSTAAGSVIGLILGGYIAETYGWRWAFVLFGLPGLLLLPLILFVLAEPRKIKNFQQTSKHEESLKLALEHLKAKKSFVLSLVGCVFFYFCVYGMSAFLVSFMIRNHAIELSSAATLIGLVTVLATLIGTPVGGKLADKYSKKNISRIPLLPSVAFALSTPCFLAALITSSYAIASVFLFIALTFVMSALPVIFSCIHAVCGSKRRATAVALAMFMSNLIGAGFGPFVVGAVSDLFASSYGSASGLKISLALASLALLPASWCMFRASKTIKSDMEN